MKPTASKYKYRRTAIDDIESVETKSLSNIIVLNFKIELSWYILHCSLIIAKNYGLSEQQHHNQKTLVESIMSLFCNALITCYMVRVV